MKDFCVTLMLLSASCGLLLLPQEPQEPPTADAVALAVGDFNAKALAVQERIAASTERMADAFELLALDHRLYLDYVTGGYAQNRKAFLDERTELLSRVLQSVRKRR